MTPRAQQGWERSGAKSRAEVHKFGFFPASDTPNKAQQPQRQHPGRCHQQCPHHPQIVTTPKTASAPCCPQHEAQGAAEPQGVAGNPPSSHLHVLAGNSPTCFLSRALHRAGQTQKRRQHRRLTHPYKAAGPGDVPRPQGISDFLIFKLLGAGQPRPDFGGDLVHSSHDAGLQLGAAHTMAASQQERSEHAAKCSRGRKPPAAPSARPPSSKQGKRSFGFFCCSLTLQATFSMSASCSDKPPKIPRPPKSWEQQGQGTLLLLTPQVFRAVAWLWPHCRAAG